jgi:hypothetical protein
MRRLHPHQRSFQSENQRSCAGSVGESSPTVDVHAAAHFRGRLDVAKPAGASGMQRVAAAGKRIIVTDVETGFMTTTLNT